MNNNNRRSFSLALLLPVALAAACAPAAEATDAPAPVTPGPAPAPAATAAARYQGEVWITQWDASFDHARYLTATRAEFREAGRDRLARECETATVGGCEVRRCSNGAGLHHTDGDVYASPGRLTVDGLRGIPLPAGAFPSVGGVTVSINGLPTLWEGGEPITLRSGGADPGVGAFVADVTAPSPVALTSASLDGATLARGVDGFEVTWTGGSGLVRVELGQAYIDSPEAVRVRCEAPAAAGRVAVPAAAVARLPSRPNTPLYVTSVARATASTDDLALDFELRTIARFDRIAVR